MQEAYYYIRHDHQNRPVITICLMYDGAVLCRGMAVCSPDDQPCKKTGRRIARDKCLRAFGLKKSGCQIKRGEAFGVLISIEGINLLPDFAHTTAYLGKTAIWYKSIFDTSPQNNLEKKIFENFLKSNQDK
ncbi:MAG: hypothetical protein ACYSW3_24580 [Planctomycetota bacterium]|jgi:hypothetical protein